MSGLNVVDVLSGVNVTLVFCKLFMMFMLSFALTDWIFKLFLRSIFYVKIRMS